MPSAPQPDKQQLPIPWDVNLPPVKSASIPPNSNEVSDPVVSPTTVSPGKAVNQAAYRQKQRQYLRRQLFTNQVRARRLRHGLRWLFSISLMIGLMMFSQSSWWMSSVVSLKSSTHWLQSAKVTAYVEAQLQQEALPLYRSNPNQLRTKLLGDLPVLSDIQFRRVLFPQPHWDLRLTEHEPWARLAVVPTQHFHTPPYSGDGIQWSYWLDETAQLLAVQPLLSQWGASRVNERLIQQTTPVFISAAYLRKVLKVHSVEQSESAISGSNDQQVHLREGFRRLRSVVQQIKKLAGVRVHAVQLLSDDEVSLWIEADSSGTGRYQVQLGRLDSAVYLRASRLKPLLEQLNPKELRKTRVIDLRWQKPVYLR